MLKPVKVVVVVVVFVVVVLVKRKIRSIKLLIQKQSMPTKLKLAYPKKMWVQKIIRYQKIKARRNLGPKNFGSKNIGVHQI